MPIVIAIFCGIWLCCLMRDGLAVEVHGDEGIDRCKFAIAPSGLSDGLGVFALQSLSSWQAIDVAVGVPIPLEAIYWTPLLHFVEGYNSSHCLLTLGSGMLLNHHDNRNIVNTWKTMSPFSSQMVFRSPLGSSIDLIYEMSADVAPGTQLFVDYGFDWFVEHGIDYQSLPISFSHGRQSIAEQSSYDQLLWTLQQLKWPVCPHQYTTMRDGQVYASQAIAANTVIEVSRGLLLPITASLLRAGPLEEVVWWLIDKSEAHSVFATVETQTLRRSRNPYQLEPIDLSQQSYALLLSGHGPFYGSLSSQIDSDAANVRMEFTEIPFDNAVNADDEEQQRLTEETHSVDSLTQSTLKMKCTSQMLVNIVTTRSVAVDEPLVLGFEMESASRRRFAGREVLHSCWPLSL